MRLLTVMLLFAVFGCEAKMPQISTSGIEAIDLQIYKDDLMGVKEDSNLTIPNDDWNVILDFILPHKWAEVGRNNLRIATATIKYKDKESVSIDVFWHGKNPCLVSLDGKHFYYAKNIPGAADGASGLIRKVKAIRSQKEKDAQVQKSKEYCLGASRCPEKGGSSS